MAKTKTKPAAKRGRPKKVKQRYLPGCEPPSIPIIDKLADEYADIRDQRMLLTKEEVDAADKLELKMKEHGLTAYEYDGKVVSLVNTEKVKVRKKTPAEFVHDAAAKNGDGEE